MSVYDDYERFGKYRAWWDKAEVRIKDKLALRKARIAELENMLRLCHLRKQAMEIFVDVFLEGADPSVTIKKEVFEEWERKQQEADELGESLGVKV